MNAGSREKLGTTDARTRRDRFLRTIIGNRRYISSRWRRVARLYTYSETTSSVSRFPEFFGCFAAIIYGMALVHLGRSLAVLILLLGLLQGQVDIFDGGEICRLA